MNICILGQFPPHIGGVSSHTYFLSRELVKRGDECKIILAGFKGELGDAMEEKINNAGLTNQIKLLGLRKDIPLLMSAADVLFFPSLWEGLGMVAVEAQAAGLKVVAADNLPDEAFIIKELVKKKSILSPVADWVDAIIQSASNHTDRKQYERKISESLFSINNSVQGLAKLYNISL